VRAADAPKLLDDWAIGLICGIAGTLVVVAVIIAVAAIRRRQNANNSSDWKHLEEPLISDSLSNSERSISPRTKLNAKGVVGVPTSSPNVTRRGQQANNV